VINTADLFMYNITLIDVEKAFYSTETLPTLNTFQGFYSKSTCLFWRENYSHNIV